MSAGTRYEVLDRIAVGDFASVYRARDRELGREVAIKQIHPQFLHDERQLSRYWQEAQLLATLQHPNILTIYDVVRSRGWLIVELMRGNLEQFARGEPIDLDYLRLALGGCLSALEFLHRNGVIHGDVKPSNILIDSQGRVKLGDFGLARRAANDSGSLLKGTTKYMAPELVSNQFGAVGPASDIYSLGFSAFELMVGANNFESLFPGLSSFGRDKQIAWMMWHAATDRHLPEVHRVLEGVPPDLAAVVQKMIAKDQTRRYQSARQALTELRVDPLAAPPLPGMAEDPATMAAEAAAARKKKRLRLAAAGALIFSILLCVVLLWPREPEKKQTAATGPLKGVVSNVYPDEWKIAIRVPNEDGKGETIKEVELKRHDRVFINDKTRELREIRPDDLIVVQSLRDDAGRRIYEIKASRPVKHKGVLKEVKPEGDGFVLTIGEGDEAGKDLAIEVPKDFSVPLNGGNPETGGKTVPLADLLAGDRVAVAHLGTDAGRRATEMSAQRLVTVEGKIAGVDVRQKVFEVALADGSTIIKLTYDPACEVTVNNQRMLNDQVLKPADLKPGDKATLSHDVAVRRVSAYRVLGEGGVVQRVQYDNRMIDVQRSDDNRVVTYQVSPQCQLTLGGETIQLTELRNGDQVDITHDTPGAAMPRAIRVAAIRPIDPNRWAILVANQDYESQYLTKIVDPLADVKVIGKALVDRYRVSPDQCVTLTDESLVRLREGLPERLKQIGPEASVLLYYAAHAYKDDEGVVYLAPKSFDYMKMKDTGLPLQWLVDLLEECPAKQKMLFLDCSRAGGGNDLKAQPSTAEMLRTLKAPPGRAALRTVTAIVSTKPGQRGVVKPNQQTGETYSLFAWFLSQAYLGRADKNLDNILEPTELFGYLNEALLAATAAAQAPELFLPDARPPRLTEDAEKAIRAEAALVRQDKPDKDRLLQAYLAASQAAGQEIEPKVLYSAGLLRTKQREQRDEALKLFEELKIERPQLAWPPMGIAWVHVETRKYKAAIDSLADMVNQLPKPQKAGQKYAEEAQAAVTWAGRLREFAEKGSDVNDPRLPAALAALDAAVKTHDDEMQTLYGRGRSQTLAKLTEFDDKIDKADEADKTRLKIERRQIGHYASFPYDELVQRVLAGLDQ